MPLIMVHGHYYIEYTGYGLAEYRVRRHRTCNVHPFGLRLVNGGLNGQGFLISEEPVF